MKFLLIIFALGITVAFGVPQDSENVESDLQEDRNIALKSGIYDADIFRELRDVLRDNDDPEIFKAKVEELFGKDSEMSKSLVEALRDDGRISVLNFFNRLIGDEVIYSDQRRIEKADFNNFLEVFRNLTLPRAKQLINLLKENGEKGKEQFLEFLHRIVGEKERKTRSISNIYEKVKDYFKDLNIDITEKFVKFGEYVKDQYQKTLDKSKTKAENVKKIAKEFLEDGRNISKEIAEEALEFFREYKQDLGRVYDDLVAKVRNITEKKE